MVGVEERNNGRGLCHLRRRPFLWMSLRRASSSLSATRVLTRNQGTDTYASPTAQATCGCNRQWVIRKEANPKSDGSTCGRYTSVRSKLVEEGVGARAPDQNEEASVACMNVRSRGSGRRGQC